MTDFCCRTDMARLTEKEHDFGRIVDRRTWIYKPELMVSPPLHHRLCLFTSLNLNSLFSTHYYGYLK